MISLLIDCNYICHRAYYSTGNLSYEKNPTGIAYGFFWTILQMSERFKTNKILFCWDSRKSIRKSRSPTYKANRNENLTDEEQKERAEMHAQFNRLQIYTLPSMGFSNSILAQVEYEADDLIAKVVEDYPDKNFVAISSDNDLFQLLQHKNFKMFSPVGNKLWTASSFMAEYGIPARDWPTIKAIAGCPGDNVNGVPGVAIKIAVKYLKDELPVKSRQTQKINENISLIRSNYKLVRLPYPGMQRIEIRPDILDADKTKIVFKKLGFNSFLSNDTWNRWKTFIERG